MLPNEHGWVKSGGWSLPCSAPPHHWPNAMIEASAAGESPAYRFCARCGAVAPEDRKALDDWIAKNARVRRHARADPARRPIPSDVQPKDLVPHVSADGRLQCWTTLTARGLRRGMRCPCREVVWTPRP